MARKPSPTQARAPASFASNVTAVLGLSSLSKVALPKPSVRSAAALRAGKAAFPAAGLPTSLNYPATYTPQQLNAMYDAPSAQSGAGQQLAIITERRLIVSTQMVMR